MTTFADDLQLQTVAYFARSGLPEYAEADTLHYVTWSLAARLRSPVLAAMEPVTPADLLCAIDGVRPFARARRLELDELHLDRYVPPRHG